MEASCRDEVARITHATRKSIEEVGIERHDDARAIQPVTRFDAAAKREPCAVVGRIAVERLVLMPVRLGQALQ